MNQLPNLSTYSNISFDRGKPRWMEGLWRVVSFLVFENGIFPFYAPKRGLIRMFGGSVGVGTLIKPNVKITFPWKLKIGDHSWIGEKVWIDSLAQVSIADHVTISQGAYICTGSHNYKSISFELITKPVHIQKGAWVCAFGVVGPGVVIEEGSVLCLGSVAKESMDSFGIYQGNPAVKIKTRVIL